MIRLTLILTLIYVLTPFYLKAQRHSYETDSKGNIQSRWYNLGVASNRFQNVNKFTWTSHLFPDTAVIFESQGKLSPAVYHSIATILDPLHPFFSKTMMPEEKLFMNNFMPYTFDSLSIYYTYKRIIQNGIPDTLIIQTFAINSNFKFSRWTGATATKFGTDTLELINVKYDAITRTGKLDNVSIQTQKVLLHAKDTASFRLDISITPISVIADQWIGAIISFKPGYIYQNGDLASSLNTFYFNSWEEMGPGSNDYPTYIKKDWNCSYIANNQSCFTPGDSWFGYYIPSFMMDKSYSLEHHDIDFHIYADMNAIREQQQTSPIMTVYPNPSNGLFQLKNLSNDAAQYTWQITSVSGAILSEGILHNRSEMIQTDLPDGFYYLSLNSNGYKLTTPIMIMHE